VTDPDIQKLIDGFGQFRAQHFETEDSLYQRLTRHGQSPRVMVIACCDSRVDPAIITHCDPGDLFVVRNVANLVPPCENDGHYHGTSAAIEFAVRVLHVRHVIVLGHAHCGGIQALVGGIPGNGDAGQFIRPWMAIAEAVRTAGSMENAQALRAAEQGAVRISLKNLMSFPWVRKRVENGLLALHGWYFDLDNGELLECSPGSDHCTPLR